MLYRIIYVNQSRLNGTRYAAHKVLLLIAGHCILYIKRNRKKKNNNNKPKD